MTPHPATVLILGGTTEGRALATRAAAASHLQVVTSLAGRVREPAVVPGHTREGGFGGVEGLVAWLREHRCSAVVDATHPFAATMSAHAAAAAFAAGVPILRFTRAQWTPCAGDHWVEVDTVEEAAARIDHVGSRALITTGRQTAGAYRDVRAFCLMRSIDPPLLTTLPHRHTVVLDRGPFTVAGELSVLREHRLDVVVTKNSGGEGTVAKLRAARELQLPVIMVKRPAELHGVPLVHHVDEAMEWVVTHTGG